MHFLNPIWLFSIAAVSIPVIIHLWNIRPGKTLKVGSISLIEASSRKRSSSFKLLDLLLLLLRCLFLIILAFVLAMPYLHKSADVTKSKAWLLISKENFKEAYQKFKPKADSLLKAGYELHYFDAGFPKVDIKLAAADTVSQIAKGDASYWDLLRQLDQQAPNGANVYLFTPASLKNFSGSKPQTALKLNWQTYQPADSVSTWIQSAWFTANKDVHVIQGTSKASGTFFTAQTINSGTEKSSAYNIDVNNGRPVISLKNGDSKPVAIDTTALIIEVFAGSNALDAGYVKAALETVGQFTQRSIVIKSYNSAGAAKADWLFWLSDSAPDKSILNNFNNVLMYEGGKINTVNSWINTNSVHSIAQGQPVIPLYKSIAAKANNTPIIWHDGFGNPLLTSEVLGKTDIYHCYTHFNPGWSDLVWNDSFPKMMLQLVVNSKPDENGIDHDRRTVDNKQIQPVNVSEESVAEPSGKKVEKDYTKYFWLVMAALFFAERLVAYKKSAGKKGVIV